MFGWLAFILWGAFVGWIASLLTKRDEQQGALANILVGIAGAFLGGVMSQFLTGADRSALELDFSSLVWATIGAVVLCMILNLIQRGRVR